MTVRSEPAPPSAPTRRAGLGVLRPATIERVFIALIYTFVGILALLSVFGTFYGMQDAPAPLTAAPLATLVTMAQDAAAAPRVLLEALIIQGVLTVAQWGARQLARRQPRWWLFYLAALGVSVYYNIVAYFDPAVALGVPWLLALLLIIGGDAVTELAVVRNE